VTGATGVGDDAGGVTAAVVVVGRGICGNGGRGTACTGGIRWTTARADGANTTKGGPIGEPPAGGLTGTVTRPGRETANTTATAPVAIELRGSTATARCRSGPGITVKCAPLERAFRPSMQ
jgi:hypothetical protein